MAVRQDLILSLHSYFHPKILHKLYNFQHLSQCGTESMVNDFKINGVLINRKQKLVFSIGIVGNSICRQCCHLTPLLSKEFLGWSHSVLSCLTEKSIYFCVNFLPFILYSCNLLSEYTSPFQVTRIDNYLPITLSLHWEDVEKLHQELSMIMTVKSVSGGNYVIYKWSEEIVDKIVSLISDTTRQHLVQIFWDDRSRSWVFRDCILWF